MSKAITEASLDTSTAPSLHPLADPNVAPEPESTGRRLVAIEGLPGSGHSEFAEWIGQQEGWFTSFPPRRIELGNAGRTSGLSPLLQQLLDRYELAQSLVGTDLFRERLVTDQTFATHSLWARALLPEREWQLYEKIAAVIVPPPVNPDLIVYLQAPDVHVSEALRRLDRGVEPERWLELATSYHHHFFGWQECPVLVVRTQKSLRDATEEARRALWRQISDFRGTKMYLMGEGDIWAGGQPSAD